MLQTCSLTLMRHLSGVPSIPHVPGISDLAFEELVPLGHHLAALYECITATVCLLDFFWDTMRERGFCNFAGETRVRTQ